MPDPTLADLFAALPMSLRTELLAAFNQIAKNFRERRWEPAELNGGKLCEVAYSILKGYVDGTYPDRASKPRNMVAACLALETATTAPRSVRVQIPRMLIALYEIRNNRNVGHVGGDVDPNHMDAACVLQMSKWVLAELIRVLHGVTVDEAQSAVESLTERDTPLIWDVNGIKRVMNLRLTMSEKTLLLLHASSGPIAESSLVSWLEHSNASVYRRDVLKKLHRDRLIEYDEGRRTALISPRGITHFEEQVLPSLDES